MKRVLWLSKHRMLMAELMELNRLIGQFSLFVYKKKVSSAEWIIDNLIIPRDIDIVIAVLPLTIISKLAEYAPKYGYEVWWSDMKIVKFTNRKPEPVKDYDPDTETYIPANGKFKIVRFNKYFRVKEIKLVLEEIENESDRCMEKYIGKSKEKLVKVSHKYN